METIRLSASKLNVLNECPRCFYDINVLNIPRARTPFPTLPGGIDRVLKGYFDDFRAKWKVPPEIQEHVGDSTLFDDQGMLNRWRNWRSGLTTVVPIKNDIEVTMIGAFDDLLINQSDQLSPFDYKTKGQEPKDSGLKYYQTQMDVYGLMLKANGYPLTGNAYLFYVWPESAGGDASKEFLSRTTTFSFRSRVYKVGCEPGRAVTLIEKAVDVICGDRPDSSAECDHCRFTSDRIKLAKKA